MPNNMQVDETEGANCRSRNLLFQDNTAVTCKTGGLTQSTQGEIWIYVREQGLLKNTKCSVVAKLHLTFVLDNLSYLLAP